MKRVLIIGTGDHVTTQDQAALIKAHLVNLMPNHEIILVTGNTMTVEITP